MKLEPDEEEITVATEGLGFSAMFGFGKKMVCGVQIRFGVRLNSKKKWKTDRQFHILREASCRDVVFSMAVVVRFNEASTGR